MVPIVHQQKLHEKARARSNRIKASKGQISPHTQPTTPFPSGGSLLVRIQDDWCRMIKASPRPRVSFGLPRFRLDRLARACWLLSKLWLQFRLNFGELRLLCSTLYWRPSSYPDQPEQSSQWFSDLYFSPWWPAPPGRRPVSILYPLLGTT